MENLVSDEDFMMILLTSLPESWDNYTTSFLGSTGNKPMISSHELIAVLLEEDRCCKGREPSGTALYAKARDKGKSKGGHSRGDNKDKECYNCYKKGHIASKCWAKGGGKEGQGPKGQKGSGKGNCANQAQDNVKMNLIDVIYMATTINSSRKISKYDWILDPGTTSHICTARNAFTDYYPTPGATLKGVGTGEVAVEGRETINLQIEFDGKVFHHQLRHTLHISTVPNYLLLATHFDNAGGMVESGKGVSWLKNKDGKVVGKGFKHQRLYPLAARAVLLEQKQTNYIASPKLSWEQWHQ